MVRRKVARMTITAFRILANSGRLKDIRFVDITGRLALLGESATLGGLCAVLRDELGNELLVVMPDRAALSSDTPPRVGYWARVVGSPSYGQLMDGSDGWRVIAERLEAYVGE